MADPISMAGTAVGITSLGVQACRAVFQFYSQFRSLDDDVKAVLIRAEVLEGSLKAVESDRQRAVDCDGMTLQHLQHAIETCGNSLIALKTMATRCGEIRLPISAEDRRRLLKKRLLWPFRQETLTKLRTTLDELQANVQLALQVLEADAGRRRFETIESSLSNHTQSLYTIREGLGDIMHSQQRVVPKLSQISLQIACVEHRLELLVAPHNKEDQAETDCNQTSGTDSCVNLRRATKMNSFEEGSSNSEEHSEPNHQLIQRKSKRNSVAFSCNCRRIETILWWTRLGNHLELNFSRETEHRSNCAHFHHGKSSYRIQSRLVWCTQLLGFSVNAGVSYIKESGWTSIHPTLSIRKIVPDDSPAFSTIRTARAKWNRGVTTNLHETTSPDAQFILSAVSSEVLRSIQNGLASPFDTLPDGSTILHEALDLALVMMNRGYIDAHTARTFLGTFITNGIPGYRTDHLASDLIYQFLSGGCRETNDNMTSLASYLISVFGTWSSPHLSSELEANEILRRLLNLEGPLDTYDFKCPLLFAIQRRSKRDLVRELLAHQESRASGHDHCFCTTYSLKLVCGTVYWPEGIRILLPSKILDTYHGMLSRDYWGHGRFTWVVLCALETGNIESVDLLSQAGYPVYPQAWFTTCLWYSRAPAELFRHLASEMQNLNAASNSKHIPRPRNHARNSNLDGLYHTPFLSLKAAMCLWETGFHNVDDSSLYEHLDRTYLGTPLWVQSTKTFRYFERFQYWKLVEVTHFPWSLGEWLVDKGGKLDWVHPTLRTTPAHMIGLTLACESYFNDLEGYASIDGDPEARFFTKVLSLDHLDDCSCHCSDGGCQAIGCAAKLLWFDSTLLGTVLSPYQEFVLEIISTVVDSRRSHCPCVGLTVIRVFTFEELGLTHTCCKSPKWNVKQEPARPSEQHISDVHYVESKGIETFEGLMFEFERTWRDHSGTFKAYFEDVWKPRMEEVRGRTFEADLEDPQRIEETGVILWEPFGPQVAP